MDDRPAELDIHLLEYEKCKAEQMARIAFRDNLVYVTLAAYGAIVAFAAKDMKAHALVITLVISVQKDGHFLDTPKLRILISMTSFSATIISWERKRARTHFSSALLESFAGTATFWILQNSFR